MAEHIQPAQGWCLEYGDFFNYISHLIDAGPSFSLVDGERVLAMAGVWVMEPHRGLAWSVLADDLGFDMYYVNKAVSDFLNNTDIRRIEMAVDLGFREAQRWAEMLGFKLEGVMEKYFPNEADAFLYARVK
jgi:hypothetical protein